jgi:hypothetical protein
MIKFVIKDTATAFNAVEWCINRFSLKDWDIRPSNQGWQVYVFEFQNRQDATLFSLAWSEYTNMQ